MHDMLGDDHQRKARARDAYQQVVERTPEHAVIAGHILYLQRTVGNQAVGRLLRDYQAGDGAARRDQGPVTGRGAGGPAQRKTGGEGQDATTDEPGVDTLLWVLDDVLNNETNRLIPDVTDRYKAAFEKLYQALVGHDLAHKKIFGRERREIFDEAVLALRPVLAHATGAQRDLLQSKRAVLLRAEAVDRVDNALVIDKKLVEIPDERYPREQAAVIRPYLPKLVQTMQVANEQFLRLGHEQMEEALEHLTKGGHADILARLATLQGLLGLADGWLSLTDEELQHQLSHIQGDLPGVTTFGELVKAIVEIGIGSVSLTATLAAAIAKVTGEAVMASAAMAVAGQAGHLLGNVVAGIEIVQGVLALLDPTATHAQKERAAVGVASGGAWFAGKRIGGAATGAAASVAVVATYLELKAAAYLYWQGALGVTTLVMREAFEYMRQYGASMARAAENLARAGLLLHEEQNPLKAAPLAEIEAESTRMLATAVDDFLQHCLSSGKDMGVGSSDPAGEPGNYEILVEAFAPLQPLRGVTSGLALAAAATAVIEKITWLLAHASEIVVASAKGHKRLHDVEEETAKAAQGP